MITFFAIAVVSYFSVGIICATLSIVFSDYCLSTENPTEDATAIVAIWPIWLLIQTQYFILYLFMSILKVIGRIPVAIARVLGY